MIVSLLALALAGCGSFLYPIAVIVSERVFKVIGISVSADTGINGVSVHNASRRYYLCLIRMSESAYVLFPDAAGFANEYRDLIPLALNMLHNDSSRVFILVSMLGIYHVGLSAEGYLLNTRKYHSYIRVLRR